ncbi:hypothetical protein SAY86_019491 [Trapa natans]|uniref:Uncharacterized protein n=1 Tax=Trapa natans TaxID=22666 RepID=A0AAN7LK28_TRANT|nr:hypothetical protein SAY86_019491 [Trapa natans]
MGWTFGVEYLVLIQLISLFTFKKNLLGEGDTDTDTLCYDSNCGYNASVHLNTGRHCPGNSAIRTNCRQLQVCTSKNSNVPEGRREQKTEKFTTASKYYDLTWVGKYSIRRTAAEGVGRTAGDDEVMKVPEKPPGVLVVDMDSGASAGEGNGNSGA